MSGFTSGSVHLIYIRGHALRLNACAINHNKCLNELLEINKK